MQFLMWDAQRRAGITDEQITQAMIDKLAVNKARQWPEPMDGEPRMHLRSEDESLNASAAVIVNQMRALANMKRPHNAKPDWRKTD